MTNNVYEIWIDIIGYEGAYSVSNLGRVASNHYGKRRILRPRLTVKGYLQVNLSRFGTLRTFRVHRLVATHFLPNPLGLTEVNHRDENKTNNRLDNLEWCTRSYNVNYGTRIARQRTKLIKPVVQYDQDGNFIAVYDSLSRAGQTVGASVQHIAACCKRKLPHAHGFIWRYLEEVRNESQ